MQLCCCNIGSTRIYAIIICYQHDNLTVDIKFFHWVPINSALMTFWYDLDSIILMHIIFNKTWIRSALSLQKWVFLIGYNIKQFEILGKSHYFIKEIQLSLSALLHSCCIERSNVDLSEGRDAKALHHWCKWDQAIYSTVILWKDAMRNSPLLTVYCSILYLIQKSSITTCISQNNTVKPSIDLSGKHLWWS